MSKIIESIVNSCNLSVVSPALSTSISGASAPDAPSHLLGFLKEFGKKAAYLEHFTAFQQDHIRTYPWNYDLHDQPNDVINSHLTHQNYYVNAHIAGVNKTITQNNEDYPLLDHLSYLTDIAFGKSDESNFSHKTLIFPGIRHIAENFIVFEMPPAHRHVSYQEAYRDTSTGFHYREFYIPIPWQIYIATFTDDMRLASVQMYFSKTPLYSFDQSLYVAPIFNFYSDGTLCRPFFEKMEDIEKYSKDYSGIMASAFDWIWNSGFNWDITENISEYLFTKKFLSMKPFVNLDTQSIIDHMAKSSYPTNGASSPDQTRQLFAIWQQVSLEDILQVDWNAFCIHEDFNHLSYMQYATEQLSSLVFDYAEKQGCSLVTEYESEEDAENEEIITYDEIFNDSKLRRLFHQGILNYNSTFYNAYEKACRHVSKFNAKSPTTPDQSFVNRLTKFIIS